MQQHPFIGMWVTKDGHVRQELCRMAAMTKRAARGEAPTKADTRLPAPVSTIGTIPALKPMASWFPKTNCTMAA